MHNHDGGTGLPFSVLLQTPRYIFIDDRQRHLCSNSYCFFFFLTNHGTLERQRHLLSLGPLSAFCVHRYKIRRKLQLHFVSSPACVFFFSTNYVQVIQPTRSFNKSRRTIIDTNGSRSCVKIMSSHSSDNLHPLRCLHFFFTQ